MVITPRWIRGIGTWEALYTWLALIRNSFSRENPLHDAAARQAQRAGIETFETFVHQHERPILNFLWRMTADEQTANDLSQETFLRAWQHFAKIREYERPSAWLFRVATNLAISHLRSQPETPADISVVDDEECTTTADPIIHFVESDLVRQILHALPPRRRAALILCEVYGLTAEEVAQVLGMTHSSLKMTLSRGREQFRQMYAKEMQS